MTSGRRNGPSRKPRQGSPRGPGHGPSRESRREPVREPRTTPPSTGRARDDESGAQRVDGGQRFSELLRRELLRVRPVRPAAPDICTDAAGRLCTVCHASRLSHDDEFTARARALTAFWDRHALTAAAEPLRGTGAGRWYRLVSKRRARRTREGVVLGLIDPADGSAVAVRRCAIEHPLHSDVHASIRDALASPRGRALGPALHTAVVKGDDTGLIVVLSVEDIDAGISRAATHVSKSLTRAHPVIRGVFLYHDDGDGRYYMGSRAADAAPDLRTIFGHDRLTRTVHGRTFVHGALAFTQSSDAAAATLVDVVAELLAPESTAWLTEFYCGYGLFALSLADRLRGVRAFELSHTAVGAAIGNARRLGAGNARIIRAAVTPDTVIRAMRQSTPRDLVLLDPPRGGTDEGVIDAIAAHSPARVVHLFCAIDRVPVDLARWASCGYRAERIVPVDAFPGTDEVETVVLLRPVGTPADT